MAGIPEARFRKALFGIRERVVEARGRGHQTTTIAGLDVSELVELALLLVAVGSC
jgi:hypothetical protein